MKRIASRWTAAASALLMLGTIEAARRPRYGGALRVEMRDVLRSLDPVDPSSFSSLLENQVFETLVRLDNRGQPQPWLAISWSHEPAMKRWVFMARPNVMLHNGSAWSLPGGVITVSDDRPIEQILRDLARPRNAVVLKAEDGSLVGTGPFRIAQWQPAKAVTLAAHDNYWGGRPYLDTIEIQMGHGAGDPAIDLEVGKADAVEVPVTDLRRLRQRGVSVSTTAPVETLALLFENVRVSDAVREAVALSIDRAAIHTVLLQRQGEISGALLPRWLSGYSFLFAAERNVARARQLGSGQVLSFGYDRQDGMIRVIAERIAVNAGEAGITLRPSTGAADVRLVRLPVISRDALSVLADLAAILKMPLPPADAGPYEGERAMLDGFRVVPLLHLPRAWALHARVRNWPHLADVWLDPREKP